MRSNPLYTETTGDYVTEWYCEPPEVGEVHRVTKETWPEPDTRRIFAWEPAEGAESA